ncbi:ABC transporter substrate-binding protein [Flexivirga sp. B27]
MQPSRRHLLSGSAVLALGTLLAACGSDSGGTSSSSGEGSAPSSGAFPVTVKHKYGSTTVKKAPKRVVCVGVSEQDTLLALGVVPVGVTSYVSGAPGEIYPWAKDKLGSAPLPEVLDGQKLNPEKIAALRPDLILATYSALTKAQYDELSHLAPTVAQQKGTPDYGTPWDVTAQMTADAIGKGAEGKKLVASVKAKLAKAKKDHPQFHGKDAVVATTYEGIYLYAPADARSVILHELGFSYPAKFKNIGGKNSFGGSISAERATQVDFDVVVWLNSKSEVDKGTGGLWEKTTAAKEGRGIFIPSSVSGGKKMSTYATAFSLVTPLSIPWLLQRYVPQLVAAVDGKVSTKVPSPTK